MTAALLLEAGLSNVLVAAALALLAIAAGRWGRRPALTHGLWLLVLLKLVTPPVLPLSLRWLPAESPAVVAAPPAAPQTVLTVETPRSEPIVEPAPESTPLPDEAPPTPTPTPAEFAQTTPKELTRSDEMPPAAADVAPVSVRPGPPAAGPPQRQVIDTVEPVADAAPAQLVVEGVLPPSEPEPAPAVADASTIAWPERVAGVWLAGSGLWLLLVVYRVRSFGRVLRHSAPPAPDFAAEVAEVAGRLGFGSAPRVRLVPGVIAPMVWSFGRPTVFFPVGLIPRLSAEQRATLIAHELAHLRRADHWVRWLEVAALALYWWCPLAWWAKRGLHRAEEECCDAWVVEALPGARRSYAAALLDTIDFLADAPPAPALASGVGGAESVKRRLLLILDGPRPKRLPFAARLLLVCAALALLPLAPRLARLSAGMADDPPAPAAPVEAQPAPSDGPYGEPVRFGGRPTKLQSTVSIWWAVAVSPDGRLLVTTHQAEGSEGGEVWVWDREAGKVIHTLREPSGVRAAIFSPDGKTLVTGNFDNAVRCYDVATWTMWGYGHKEAGGHSNGVNGLAFTADGKYLASAGLDHTARLWDFEAIRKARIPGGPIRFAPVAVFEGHTSGVFAVAISADGKRLLTGSGDHSARIWDVPAELPTEPGKRVTVKEARAVIRDHTLPVEAVAVSPDGKTFVTGSWDTTVKLRNPAGEVRETLTYELQVLGLAFDRDGKHLAVSTGVPGGNGPAPVHVVSGGPGWESPESKPLGEKPHSGPVYSVAFLPDGKTVASASRDRSLRLRAVGDPGGGRVLRNDLPEAQADQTLLAAALSPDGKRLVVGGESKVALVWDVAARKVVRVLAGHSDVIAGVAYTPDGKVIATAGHDKTIKLWDAETGQELRTLKGHTNWVFAVAFSPDGKTLASGGYDRTVRLWDVETGEPKATWKEHTAAVRSVAFTPDGKRLVSGSSDRTLRVWDVEKGQMTASLKGHKGAVRSVAVSPDGKTVASAAEDKTVRIWDLESKDFRAVNTSDLATAVQFSPKGHVLLAGTYGGDIANINPATGAVRGTFGGFSGQRMAMPVPVPGAVQSNPSHGDAVTVILFAPDGRQVISVSQDKNVYLWKPADPPASARLVFRGHGEPVSRIAVSPDGKLLATAGRSGTVKLWDADTGGQRHELPSHPGGVSALVFLGDGKRLLTAGAAGLVRVCDIAMSDSRVLCKPGAAVTCVAATADGKLVAVSLAGKPDVLLYDPASPAEPRKLTGHTEAVNALAFSPDGKALLSGGADGQIVLWDVAAGKETKRYPAKAIRTGVDALAFSPDGKKAAAVLNYAGTPDGNDVQGEPAVHEAVVFDPDNGPPANSPVTVFPGGAVTAAAFTRDGKQLVIATETGKLTFWEPDRNRVARSLDAHFEGVTALAVGHDGGSLYTAGDDFLAKRWDLPNPANYFMQARLFANSDKQVWATFFSPDGKTFASVGDDAMVRLRTAVPGEGRTWVNGEYPTAFSVALSPDESLLASGHLEGTVRLTDMKTGRERRKFTGLVARAWTVAFSPDGKRLAAVGGDWQEGGLGWVKVWDVADGKEVFSSDHPATTFGVAYSTDGKRLATGCRDGKVRVYDTTSWEPVQTLEHGGGVRTVTYSPDGKALVSGGYDGRVVFWDPETGEAKLEHNLGDKMRVNQIVFARDRKTYAVTYNEVGDDGQQTGRMQVRQLGEAEPRQTIKDFTGMVLDAAFHPDGVTLAAVGGRYNQFPEFRFFDVATGVKMAGSPGHRHWIEAVIFNKDGSLIISGGGVAGEPGEIRIRSIAGLRPRAVLKGHPKAIQAGTFSPDGSLIATGGADGSVLVWDVAKAMKTGGVVEDAVRYRLKGCPTGVRRVLFTKDGRRLFASGEDGTVNVWDAATGSEVQTLKAHGLPVYAMALSPDGKTLATGAGDWKAKSHGEVRLWNAETLERVAELPRQDQPVWSVAWGKDGRTLYAGGAGVSVWDVPSRKLLRRAAAGMSVRTIAVSADGRFLAAGHGTQGQVKVFDVASLQEIATLGQHQKLIMDVAFSPDGRLLASSSGDGSAIVWRNQTVQAELEKKAAAAKAAMSAERK